MTRLTSAPNHGKVSSGGAGSAGSGSGATLSAGRGGSPATGDAAPEGARGVRWLLAGVGIVFVGIGAVGAILPGLPTTIFLIIASACFARSCPWLEERLIRQNRLFAPVLCYLDPAVAIPTRARVVAAIAMWAAVTISSVALAKGGHSPLLIAAVIASAVAGSVMIATFRRGR